MTWNIIPNNKRVELPQPLDSQQNLERQFSADGIIWRPEPKVACDWLQEPFVFADDGDLVSFLSQLEEEGFAEADEEGLLLPWQALFQLLSINDYSSSIPLLRLPEQNKWRPVLSSHGSLADSDFSVTLAGWLDASGRQVPNINRIEGAVLHGAKPVLLTEESWKVVKAVATFHRRPAEERNAESNRRAWAEIRRYAVKAGADLNDFLRKTVVLTPERLQLSLSKTDVGGTRSIEVIPGFDGAPERWLEIFDRFTGVNERYEIPDGEGLVHIIISPEVGAVLGEIKRMPGRRVAGERGEAFVRNPFATLGPDAEKVLDPDEFERSLDDAGISFSRFTSIVKRDPQGYPSEVSLLIEETLHGEIRNDTYRFEGSDELGSFVRRLEERIQRGCQCCFWEGFDLEILGDTSNQLDSLKQALREWTQRETISCAELFDLSRYSERVEGFGTEKPYFSPFIARKSDGDGWIPSNISFALSYTPEGTTEPVTVALDDELLAKLKVSVQRAKEETKQEFSFPGCPRPVPLAEAEQMLAAFGEASTAVQQGTFPPKTVSEARQTTRKGLVVKPNIDALDYAEEKGSLAFPEGSKPILPGNLRGEVQLKDHQLQGVAWLQNLWRYSPRHCRGAVLADDMGLGKTVQLLCFISRCLEEDTSLEPILVVAPVALLENWKEEVDKFFVRGSLDVLTLYGDTLAEKRVPRKVIATELQSSGVSRLLRRDWIGRSKIVLTTYETLRDLEFSLAAEKWSIMVCDEAQKIKNPNALVTRAAKKQNVRFRIACTGTPVENTLTDLWCLFDFVQPGLLGALNDFGARYRRPIESESAEEKERVEELRAFISDQILRREKKEVAKDLPQKIVVDECRALPLSQYQRGLYGHSIALYRDKGEREGKKGGILGLLSHLRLVCSDPRPLGHQSTNSEPIEEIIERSPKMAWLLETLEKIRANGDKVILFCELHDLQRTLKRCIHARFGVSPDVINGSTSSSSTNPQSRQKRIRAFQDKEGFGVIILSPLAAGFGLNIQAANHVIHFTRLWNPAKEDQATDRAYRIGQTKDVHVYYPVVVAQEFKTFDAKLDELLEWKRGLSSDMLNGTGELNVADFVDLQDVDGGTAVSNSPISPEDIPKMAPETFEVFCKLLWSAQGFTTVYCTPQSNDGGVDVVATKTGEGALIQCKTSSRDGHRLGWDAIKDVVAGEAAYLRRHPGVAFKKIAATNQYFNDAAQTQAIVNGVELIDRDKLEVILAEYPVWQMELDNLLMCCR